MQICIMITQVVYAVTVAEAVKLHTYKAQGSDFNNLAWNVKYMTCQLLCPQ